MPAKFLNLMYHQRLGQPEARRCRYGIMLRDDGFVYGRRCRRPACRRSLPCDDDDRRRAARSSTTWRTISRRSSQHLKVWLTSTTEQWAVIAVQGRRRADHRAARRGHRPFERSLPPYERCRRQHMRCADQALPHVVHRRTGVRGQRTGRTTANPCGSDLGSGGAMGACAYGTETMHVPARRKRLHHRRPGHGRNPHAGRCRPFLGGIEEETGLRRHSRHEAADLVKEGPQSSSSASSRRDPQVVLGGRAQIVADPNEAKADDHARSCDLVLLVAELRPLDRARGRRRRPRHASGRRSTCRLADRTIAVE